MRTSLNRLCFGSIAFIVIGLYLLAIGAAGEWLRRTGQPLWIDLSIVLAFGSLIGLVILLFSKKAGSEIRRFIARNFYRSKYDYRARWLEVTKTFQQATTKDAIIDCLFDLLTKIFPTTTISIWSFREADRRFFKIRPITAESSGSTSIELSHPIVMQLMNNNNPVYEKGAFTGAVQQRKGRIESAQGGTLFLDEIGDIPLRLQVKLLRFLQDHKIQRLGGKEAITVDARILAATNIDLQKAISEGRFRDDLYFRLCVVRYCYPPTSRARFRCHFVGADVLAEIQWRTQKADQRLYVASG